MNVARVGAVCALTFLFSACAIWQNREEAKKPIQVTPTRPAASEPVAAERPSSRVPQEPKPGQADVPRQPEPVPGEPAVSKGEKPATLPGRSTSEPQMVSLDFEDADLQAVLRPLAKLAGINFIVAQGVRAQVTMRIEKLPASEAFSIIEAILEANNLAAVKSGDIYKIVPVGTAQQQPGPIGLGRDFANEKGYFTQIVPLQYLTADSLVQILQPLVSQGKVIGHRETNTVILSGPATVIRELVRTLKALDVQSQQREAHQIYVYYVNNTKASELAATLMSVFGEERQVRRPASGERSPFGTTPGFSPQSPLEAPPRPGVAPSDGDLLPGATVPLPPQQVRTTAEVRIVPDLRTNALIIKTTPRDYEVVKEIIKKLDITPKQVVIEALLAEVILNDSFGSSVEAFLKAGEAVLQSSFGGKGLPVRPSFSASKGFTFSFVDRDKFSIFLNMVAANTKTNIVAAPHILTQDNKPARIQIGFEVPIVTGTQSTVSGVVGSGENLFQTIQQKDIGRILTINPHVNEQRQVTLDIQLEASDSDGTTGAGGSPTFRKRSVQTAVVVEDGQSLLIGGIISEDKSRTTNEFPFLGQIPIIGRYFRTTSDSVVKTELLILLTPHVIANPEEGKNLTDQFTQRLKWLEEHLQKLSPLGRTPPATGATVP